MSDGSVCAVVLAAGAGERLRPLTELRPKALCPVGHVALVDHALARVSPVTSAVAVNIHHGREWLEPHVAGRAHLSIESPVALGTAGAVGALRDWIDGRPALVVNADALSFEDLRTFVDGWDGRRLRLLVAYDPHRADFHGMWRFAGASLMPWDAASRLHPVPSGLYEVCWRELVAAGRAEFVPTRRVFVDCGTPRDYLAANLTVSGGDSVIGDGAVVEGEVTASVVWPDARVERGERLVHAIRLPDGRTVQPLA